MHAQGIQDFCLAESGCLSVNVQGCMPRHLTPARSSTPSSQQWVDASSRSGSPPRAVQKRRPPLCSKRACCAAMLLPCSCRSASAVLPMTSTAWGIGRLLLSGRMSVTAGPAAAAAASGRSATATARRAEGAGRGAAAAALKCLCAIHLRCGCAVPAACSELSMWACMSEEWGGQQGYC